MTKVETKYNFPSEFAEKVGLEYASLTTNDHKKESGQFLTPG